MHANDTLIFVSAELQLPIQSIIGSHINSVFVVLPQLKKAKEEIELEFLMMVHHCLKFPGNHHSFS